MRLILTLFVLLSPIAAQAQTFGAEEFTLSNGMQVVVIPNHRAPVVTHMVWYKVGAADEKPGLSGMAHYLEHLLFKGTAKLAPGEFSKTVKTLGGNDNAFTGQDYTAYFESVSIDNLEKVMEMNADRMMNANPPEEHYKSEKSVVLEERRQRTDNEPRAIFAEQLNSVLFVNHPYANPVIGWMDEIKQYEWKDVKAFYETWYAPNNAILIVSGDITAKQLKPLAEKIYGSLPRKDVPERKRPQVAPANSQTLITLQDKSINQPAYIKNFIAPAENRHKSDALALEILAEILDGSATTRLYDRLIVNEKKATSVGFSYSGTALDYGSISISATPADNVTLDEIGALLDKQIQDVLINGVTETETKEAIQRLQDEAIYARDSLSGPAMIFGSYLTTGGSVAELETWAQDIAKITPQQIQEAAKRYLDEKNPWIRPPVVGHLLPAAPEEKVETDAR